MEREEILIEYFIDFSKIDTELFDVISYCFKKKSHYSEIDEKFYYCIKVCIINSALNINNFEINNLGKNIDFNALSVHLFDRIKNNLFVISQGRYMISYKELDKLIIRCQKILYQVINDPGRPTTDLKKCEDNMEDYIRILKESVEKSVILVSSQLDNQENDSLIKWINDKTY